MHDAFFDYLKKFNPAQIPASEKKLIEESFSASKLRKRQYLLQAGDRCKYFAFIVKGSMRQYTVDDKGAEHIVHLGVEGWWMGDRESWVLSTPSLYNIDAWEDTTVLLINREKALDLMKKSPVFSEMTRQLDERNNMANLRRLTSSISSTADRRYVDFSLNYPELLKRFPQHIIASYLGITKDTLSRIRRQLLQK